MVRSVWHAGSRGDLCLVEGGSGEGEREAGGAGFTRKVCCYEVFK
jgi:hypothetical protein